MKFIVILLVTVAFSIPKLFAQQSIADEMPAYRGGIEKMIQVIKKHLRYPKCCFEGAVYVSFVIETDGRLTHKKIFRGVSNTEHCNPDGEALRVLEFLTDWEPGKDRGKKVAVRMILPIKFSL